MKQSKPQPSRDKMPNSRKSEPGYVPNVGPEKRVTPPKGRK